jgi:membrane dipeptidase
MESLMKRRTFLSVLASASTAALWPEAFAGALAATWPGYREALVIDSLGGPGSYGTEELAPLGAAALNDVRASGLTAVNLTVSGIGSYALDYDRTVKNIAYWNGQIAEHPDFFVHVRRASEIAEAKRSRRLGLIYGFQDATPLAEDLERVETFWNLGVRIFQLTYNRRNLVGDGCLESGNAGLSDFGRKLIARLNARRALVDLSHAGERTTLEAIAASKLPVAISHTGCAAIAPNPRNKTDQELRTLAERGGYVGIFLMPFLRTQGQPMADDVIRHLEHAVDVCGDDHVGIGTDGTISPVELTPEFKKKFAEDVNERHKLGISAPGEDASVYSFVPDLNVSDRFQRVAALLSTRKYSDARIAKILGGNFSRLLSDVWGG